MNYKLKEIEEIYNFNNKIILNFYKDNSNINFQESNKMLINMIDLNNKMRESNIKNNLMNYDDVKDNSLNLNKKNQSEIKSYNIIKCDLCKMFTTITLKGMAAHKRGCKKK